MTSFQVICAVIFAALVCVTCWQPIVAAVTRLLHAGAGLTETPEVKNSVAVALVKDVLAVTQLRDKLAAEQCKEGVEACTVLLRVLVEYKEPSKGVV